MFTTDEFAYFAYGSNMSARRLVARVPSARVVASGFVSGCRLAFDKISNDGSGKCDCESTGVAGDRVYGVIFGVAFRDRVVLDRFEGAGAGYEPETVHVETNVCGLDALTYFATKKRFGLTPVSLVQAACAHRCTGGRSSRRLHSCHRSGRFC
jgi:gamma-glutamylcyclotransferase